VGSPRGSPEVEKVRRSTTGSHRVRRKLVWTEEGGSNREEEDGGRAEGGREEGVKEGGEENDDMKREGSGVHESDPREAENGEGDFQTREKIPPEEKDPEGGRGARREGWSDELPRRGARREGEGSDELPRRETARSSSSLWQSQQRVKRMQAIFETSPETPKIEETPLRPKKNIPPDDVPAKTTETSVLDTNVAKLYRPASVRNPLPRRAWGQSVPTKDVPLRVEGGQGFNKVEPSEGSTEKNLMVRSEPHLHSRAQKKWAATTSAQASKDPETPREKIFPALRRSQPHVILQPRLQGALTDFKPTGESREAEEEGQGLRGGEPGESRGASKLLSRGQLQRRGHIISLQDEGKEGGKDGEKEGRKNGGKEGGKGKESEPKLQHSESKVCPTLSAPT
jgi:hypothetical protein